MSMLDDAVASHFATLFVVDGIDGAVIARGAQQCTASIVLSDVEQVAHQEQEFAVEANQHDVIIAAADYAPTGSASEPELGDLITVTVASVERQYRVVVRDGGQAYEEMDHKGTYLRVFVTDF